MLSGKARHDFENGGAIAGEYGIDWLHDDLPIATHSFSNNCADLGQMPSPRESRGHWF
jgi:hypothetical protein